MKSNTEERPIIKIELLLTCKLLEISGWLILILLWVATILNYSNLPDIIPTHFDIAGKPNDFGSKTTILALPITGTLFFVGMTILNKYPHIFNYPTKITNQNARKQYTIATRLIRYLKFFLVLTFSIIYFMTSQTSYNNLSGLGQWFLPVFLGATFIPLIYAIIKLFRTT